MEQIRRALIALKQGRPIVVMDDLDRENEGDLIAACATVTDGTMNFIVKHSSGLICFVAKHDHMDQLGLMPLQSPHHKRDQLSTAFCDTFEAANGITTGISADERAHSVRIAAKSNATKEDIVSPGHLLSLRAHKEGLSGRRGHTEASIELCELAGLAPQAILVEIPDEYGGMMRRDALIKFAQTYDLPIITIDDIVAAKHQLKTEQLANSKLPTAFGDFECAIYRHISDHDEHIVLVHGDPKGKKEVVVRVHSQCLTGDLFHSLKCDCHSQLIDSLKQIKQAQAGILIWLRQEGRGIGLSGKIRAYQLQEQGLDTVEANIKLGFGIDQRQWQVAIDVLNDLGPASICLISNNPEKSQKVLDGFKGTGQVIPSHSEVTEQNKKYLMTKRDKLGHQVTF